LIPLRDDNPSVHPPVVAISFIIICVLVFLWQFSLGTEGGQRAIYALGVIPAVLLGGQHLPPELAVVPPAATILTSMFMHGGWMHLIGNMLYLWIFGDNVEDSMGHGRFVVFYVLCGVAAALAQAIPEPGSTIPMVRAARSPACWVRISCCIRMRACWSRCRSASFCILCVCLPASCCFSGSVCNC
jgi:membrane associated rhomboid family serine protease